MVQDRTEVSYLTYQPQKFEIKYIQLAKRENNRPAPVYLHMERKNSIHVNRARNYNKNHYSFQLTNTKLIINGLQA
jgi:ribosomal protein L39E